jgi:membrane-bound metal-dependent hydrolase YbcI (DUF457 family)
MPFTPYHFGPSGFLGLVFRRWIDPVVFVLVNVLIDVEVLADGYFQSGWPVHRLWHFHTLLVGGLAGAVMGAMFYFVKPIRLFIETFMRMVFLPYKAGLWKMITAGVLGAWLHVLIDSVYHYDVQTFWPYKRAVIYRWITMGRVSDVQQWIREGCIVFWILLVVVYILAVVKGLRKGKGNSVKMEQQS